MITKNGSAGHMSPVSDSQAPRTAKPQRLRIFFADLLIKKTLRTHLMSVISGQIIWLVGSTPLKNMKVNWDDDFQHMEKHVPNHQSVIKADDSAFNKPRIPRLREDSEVEA